MADGSEAVRAILHLPSSILVYELPAHAHFVAQGDLGSAACASDVGQTEGEVIVRGAAVHDVHHLALEREIRLDAVGGRRAGCAAVVALAANVVELPVARPVEG